MGEQRTGAGKRHPRVKERGALQPVKSARLHGERCVYGLRIGQRGWSSGLVAGGQEGEGQTVGFYPGS